MVLLGGRAFKIAMDKNIKKYVFYFLAALAVGIVTGFLLAWNGFPV
jgi:hypothetical protein